MFFADGLLTPSDLEAWVPAGAQLGKPAKPQKEVVYTWRVNGCERQLTDGWAEKWPGLIVGPGGMAAMAPDAPSLLLCPWEHLSEKQNVSSASWLLAPATHAVSFGVALAWTGALSIPVLWFPRMGPQEVWRCCLKGR